MVCLHLKLKPKGVLCLAFCLHKFRDNYEHSILNNFNTNRFAIRYFLISFITMVRQFFYKVISISTTVHHNSIFYAYQMTGTKDTGKCTTLFISTFNPQEDKFSLMSVLVSCDTWITLDDYSTAFTKEWEPVIIPLREVTIFAVSLLIVSPIPSTGSFPWIDAKKFQCTFQLNLLSSQSKQLAIK